MKYIVDGKRFAYEVDLLKKVIKNGADIPPMIINYVQSDFEVNDGNHRLEAYKQLEIEEVPVIIWITEEEEYEEFIERYRKYVYNANIIRK